MTKGQCIILNLGDPEHPAGTLTITECTAGPITCDLPGPISIIRKITETVQIYEDENELIQSFQNRTQEPIVVLRHPSEYSPNLFLLEDIRYYIEFESDSGNISKPLSELHDFAYIERVPIKSKQLYTVKFPSYAGHGVFDAVIDEEHYEIPFEVRCSKIEYVKEYPLMLSQISDFLTGLLLDSNSPLSERYTMGNDQSNTYYEDFILIEYLFSKLKLYDLFGYICNNIHRELITEREDSYDCTAYNVDPDTIQDLISEGFVCSRNGGSIYGHFEFSKMVNNRSKDTFDTPENRLVKDFLITLSDMLEQISACNIEGYIRCSVYEKKEMIQSMLSEWWLRDVGRLQYIPFNSNVLNSRYGYADIFRMYLMLGLNLEFKINDAMFLFEGHTNKVSQTYEYWCYIKIFEALCNLSGNPTTYKGELQKKWGLSIRGGGSISFHVSLDGTPLEIEFYYNQNTHRNHPIDSYSVPLRPDFTLIVSGLSRTKIINFDSKYKLQIVDLKEGEDDDISTTICWRADIYKMHTYKDAIYHCWGSYVLYPGNTDNWYTKKLSNDWDDISIPSVGAIPLSPLNPQNLTETIELILKSMIKADRAVLDIDNLF